jgi:hypothetical protein
VDNVVALKYAASAIMGIPVSLTTTAFDKFRVKYGPARAPQPNKIRNTDETIQMTIQDGLQILSDGPAVPTATIPTTPILDDTRESDRRLWAVRKADVVHALENCHYGTTLQTGKIKHTNLTGGADAFCGGELLFLSERTIVVNGGSGRYGPRSKAEMNDVAKAFRDSGYDVWCQGYDDETSSPFPLLSVDPVWVA